MSQFLTISKNGPVLEILLNRPPVNAITPEVGHELHRAFCEFRDTPELRAAILTATGDRIFCAGWDLKEVAQHVDPATANDATMNEPGGFGGFTELWDIKKPIIAAINGFAVGGGFEMMLAADIVVAAEHVEFQLPEMQRGFVPDAGAVQRLPRKVPYNVAVEWMLTGRRVSAREAERWGLVNFLVPKSELMTKARELAMTIAEGAPLAVRALLEVIPAIDRLPIQDAFAKMKRGQSDFPFYQQTLVSEDFLEGPRAYAEKRKPVWKGR
ncbi:MAG: enoyl-CoA hydratase-related protein [Variibacter sp.]